MRSDYESISNEGAEEKLERAIYLLVRLYAERTHFILELLQNAEDAGATRVRFDLHVDRLEVWHDATRPFSDDDVRGICDVGKGTKKDDLTQIGKFGIGFKSVYAFTRSPKIHCGDQHFTIEKYTHPHGVDPITVPSPWTTLFVLPFDQDDVAPEIAYGEIELGLAKLNPSAMLFLRHIVEIAWSAGGAGGKRYTRHEIFQGPARRVSVTSGISRISIPSGAWLIFDSPVLTDDASQDLRVEVAFNLVSEKGVDKISVANATTLSVFFPTATRTGLGFTIQGPYRTTPARDNVPAFDLWNQTLVKETAALVVTALGHLRDTKLLTTDALLTLPIRPTDFPEGGMFRPIFEAVKVALETHDLIPTDSGEFVRGAQAQIARGGGIIELFPNGPPSSSERPSGRLRWVNRVITETHMAELYLYFRKVLQIEEVTPEGIVRQLTGSFLEKMPEDWLKQLYGFLALREALWRKPRYGEAPGPARSVPIIRIEDGRHLVPFKKDDGPAAYLKSSFESEQILLVRKTIVADGPSRQFLEKLGLGEFDLIAALREFALPRYRPTPSLVPKDQNMQHLVMIDAALRETKSDEKVRAFLSEVKDTPLILASRATSTHEPCYVKPEQAYFKTDELTTYFAGNPDAWFIAEYPTDLSETLKKLGISDKERDLGPVRRRDGSYVPIEYCMRDNVHFKRRGVRGFDPELDIDGLRHALTEPTLERSRYIWNEIALPRAQQVRGVVEEATRADFLNANARPQTSKMGYALTNSAWLPLGSRFVKPAELRLEDLPDGFEQDEALGRQLGMKVDEVAAALQKAGFRPEALDLLKQFHDDPDLYAQVSRLVANAKKPVFPSRKVADPIRRAKHIGGDAETAPTKEYEQRPRSVRISEPTQDPKTWLREQYKNDSEQVICQVCEQQMPFKDRHDEYYFEAVEALNTLHKEHHALFLALCPVCAAKYHEFVKTNPATVENLRTAIRLTEHPLISLQFGRERATIRFVDSHFLDLKTLLEVLEVASAPE